MTNNQQTGSMNVSLTATTRASGLIAAELCIFVLMDALALFGNILVCLAFYRNSSLRTVTNYFILSLALSDLSMAVFVMPLKAASTFTSEWVAGDVGCKIDYFFANISAGTSLLAVMLLAVNRYFRVGRPKAYDTVFSSKRSLSMAVSVWIITIAVLISQSFMTRLQFKTSSILPSSCVQIFPNRSASISSIVIQSIYIAVPSCVIVSCYVQIYRTVHQHNKKSSVPPLQRRNSVYGVEEAKITRILTVVVVGFYLCWIPVLTTNILNFLKVIEAGFQYTNFCITFPMFTSCIINPIIYATMSQVFRKEFSRILKSVIPCKETKFVLANA